MLASGCCHWGKDWRNLPLLSRVSVGELGERATHQYMFTALALDSTTWNQLQVSHETNANKEKKSPSSPFIGFKRCKQQHVITLLICPLDWKHVADVLSQPVNLCHIINELKMSFILLVDRKHKSYTGRITTKCADFKQTSVTNYTFSKLCASGKCSRAYSNIVTQ